ncbi:HCLS1-associated protein X-1 isoform X2 [Linepithema humile]|uniref:HCLS1-associated protein X-1 isoform X2 n=1 Tax=Linepithema humile TaxID=83485 RepID=UPI00351E4A34
MSFFDFFRSFLGLNRRNVDFGTSEFGDHDSHRDSFRNPIWQSDDDDDDIDDFRHHGNGVHFNIFNDSVKMTRYFESQMDNMLKNFFGFNFYGDETIQALPFTEPEENENLRDQMLKSVTDELFNKASTLPERKIDTDLDKQITMEKLFKTNKEKVEIEKSFAQHNFFFKQFVQKGIHNSDGTMEQKQIFKDSEGNMKTIVTKEIGDKRYITTIIRDKDGYVTRSETVFHISETYSIHKEKEFSTS